MHTNTCQGKKSHRCRDGTCVRADCHHSPQVDGRDDSAVLRHITVFGKPTQPVCFHCVVQLFEHNCHRTYTLSTAASTTWTADRTNPLSRVQEDADHSLMYRRRIKDVGWIDMAMVLLFTEYGTCVNVYLHSKHIRYFTACFGR